MGQPMDWGVAMSAKYSMRAWKERQETNIKIAMMKEIDEAYLARRASRVMKCSYCGCGAYEGEKCSGCGSRIFLVFYDQTQK